MAEFTENQVYEALGITPEAPADTGAKEREPAAPAPQETEPTAAPEKPADGEREQEPAAPASGGEDPTPAEPEQDTEDGPEGTPEDQDDGKPPMDQKERHDQAQERRRREQQAAIDAEVQKAVQAEREKTQAELADFFKGAKLKNTITGEPIATMEEYRAWQKAYDQEKLRRDLAAGKLTPEGLEKAISGSEPMQKVQELIQRETEEQKQRDQAAAQAKVEADMAEIRKLDPSIQTVQDLLKLPTSKEFYELVTKNRLSFLQAFKLANQDRLAEAQKEAAKQQALNAARSKDHLSPIGAAKGKGADAIPAEEVAYFRAIMPDATEAEVRAYIEKYKKSKGG